MGKSSITAAAYARYSTDKQTENSIAYQMSEITKYCTKNGITLSALYSDKGKSGTSTADREEFERMIEAAKRKEFDAVVIYDISRGSRDVGDWFAFRKEMLRHNIRVISATQTLGDITNPNDFLTELISVGLGQHAVLDTRKKSMDGVAVKAKKGLFLGGVAPLGYDIVNREYLSRPGETPVIEREYAINPAEAAIVQKIFSMYANGESYNKIIDALGGIRGKRGHLIGKNSLYKILTNERYIGIYTWNKHKMKLFRKWAGGQLNPDCVRIEDSIPPIIEKEVWERVQIRMKDNSRKAANKAKRTYLLSGLIECDCGAAFVGHTSTSSKGSQTSYYMCGNKYRTRSCDCKNINAAKMEAFVIQCLKQYLSSTNFEEVAFQIASQINGASANFTEEKKELADVTTKINNGMKAILGGMVFPELEDEIARLRVRKSELEDVILRGESSKKAVDPRAIVELFKETVASLDEGNIAEIIRRHITKIYAHNDGSFDVNVGVHIAYCGGRI